jgi:hypothetical protein
MQLIKVFKLLLYFLVSGSSLLAQKLQVYPAPDSVLQNNDFTVKVRKPGGEWKKLFSYNVKVDEARDADHHVENASMCSFDFSGEVEVSVINNKGNIKEARIRPLSYNIRPEVKGNTVFFRLSQPHNLSVEINGDIFHNLHLFANPLDNFTPNSKDSNLIYFKPGVHTFVNRALKVPSGKTVYIAGGAVLMGQLLIDKVWDVKVIGRGVIDPSIKMGVLISNSKNVLVEGICLTQCATGASDSVTIRNVKSISYYGWGDGMNVFASNNVLFDGVFCRNSDDCTTVYGTRNGYTGGCRNITMKNSTLWADVAHPILIGTHGNPENPDTLENLNYINIDILDHKEMQVDYQGCMSINAGDNNLVRNVKFENIRVEDFRQGQLINLRVFFNQKYCTAPGKGIENVLFKDIIYNGHNAETSIISGYDSTRAIKNISFKNLVINGIQISDDMPGKPAWYRTSDVAKFFVGEHVMGISFKK